MMVILSIYLSIYLLTFLLIYLFYVGVEGEREGGREE